MIYYTILLIPLNKLLIHVIIIIQNVYVSTCINTLCRENNSRDYEELYKIVLHGIYVIFFCLTLDDVILTVCQQSKW